jgi:hypothetical protein
LPYSREENNQKRQPNTAPYSQYCNTYLREVGQGEGREAGRSEDREIKNGGGLGLENRC